MVLKYTLSLAMYIKKVGSPFRKILLSNSLRKRFFIIKMFLKKFAKLTESYKADVSFSIKLKVVG